MSLLNATFDIPAWLDQGLKSGDYIRYGGEIRNQSGQIVAMLRDAAPGTMQALPALVQINTAVGAATLGVSILSLGVSVIGFALVMGRLKKLENNLKQELTKINDKIDLGFYANFCTALSLASNIHIIEHTESRKVMSYQAIPRFLDAQHVFYDYASKSIQQGSPATDEYLLILFLAYIAEARCHLEIEELDTATHRLQEGTSKIYPLICNYTKMLLTSNPAAYLQLEDQISLSRLTRIYQFTDESFSENIVFQLNKENLTRWSRDIDKWVDSLPDAIIQKQAISGTFFADGKNAMPQFLTNIFGNREDVKQAAIKKLPQIVTNMESMIETHRRFEAYQTEVKAIAQLGISFHDWLQLAPQETQPEGSNLMYIIPTEPLSL